MKKLLLMAFICLLAACNTQKVVTVTEYRDRVQTDTLLKVDSIYVSHNVFIKGDTVRMTDTICQYRIIHDTRDVFVHDSVPYPVEVVREVRKRNGYDRFTSAGFWVLVALLLGRVAWWLFKTIYLRKL